MDENIRNNLNSSKDKLLDLGKRNQMLYLKPRAKTVISIEYPQWSVILDNINQGENLKLVRKIDLLSSEQIQGIYDREKEKKVSEEENLFSESDINLTKLSIPLSMVVDSIKKDQFVSSVNDNELMLKASRIKTRAKSLSEDSGVDALFLVLTVVNWRESHDSQEFFQAPLLMCPTALVKEKNNGFTFNPAEDEIVVNPALKIHLEKNFNVILPELKEDPEQGGYLIHQFIKEARVELSKEDFKIEDEAFVGIFAFSKIAMYNDIKNNFDALLLDKYVSAMSGGPFDLSVNEGAVQQIEDNLDKLSTSSSNMIVVDADGSQLKAIELAKAGESFVIQGPPGTGKSQTITNMVAELIANGKKVLFVSEKLAALNVVYSNLSKVSLGEFCLILHSTKTKKETIITDLYNSLVSEPTVANNMDPKISQREQLRQDLSEYIELLHEKQPFIQLSIYDLLSRFYRFSENLAYLDLVDIQRFNLNDLEDNILIIKDQLRYVQLFGENTSTHPLQGIKPIVSFDHDFMNESGWRSLFEHQRNIINTLSNLIDKNTVKNFISKDLTKLFGMIRFKFDEELLSNLNVDQAWFKPSALNSTLSDLKSMIETLTSIENLKPKFNAFFIKDTKDIDPAVIEQVIKIKSSFFWFVQPKLYQIKSSLTSYFFKKPSLKVFLQSILDIKSYQTLLTKKETLSNSLYSKIEGLDTLTIEQLKVLFSKIEYFSSIIHDVDSINQWLKTSFNQEPIELKVSNYEYVFEILSNFSKTFSFYNEGLHKAQQIFNKDKTDFSKISIYKLQTLFSELTTAIQDYVQWINFEKNQAEVAEKKLNTFITFLDSAEKLDKFQDIYRKSFYNSWGNYLVKRNRAIAGFIKEDHEEKIRRFIALDSEIIEHNKYRIRENVYKNKPFLDQNEALQYSEQLILKKEFIKKRNKLSIRKLFLAIPNLIKELKPVIMMSPITVSNYLKFGDFKFDTVIFDEASQIFPYDAIGCLARGKQVIVAGDRYQLPPTNFFLTTDDENEDIPEDEIDFTATKTNDFESILDLALSKLRKVSLMWHYRSRNESLIAFSNQEIYDNKLITFPSRNDKIPNDGVEFHYVDGGVYDRGKSRTNRKEADKIVELIVKHIKEYPERSLGVVTVNSDQQELVDALLSKRVDGHRNLESFVYGETNEKEPFFIKNIESVQGDERDTIIFGIGYGKDPGGNFSMNFGPINKVGGERRLNVAISRSKINMKVVASVHGTEFRLTDSTPRGLKLLAEYLDYAEKGNSVLKTIVKHNAQVSESGFEEDVAMVLERHNFMIEKQVGVSSFRIDLAVRHPDRPKVYAIGIECDGATYHSGKIARDRDRLRQMVLERLGWKIYRIWSTDWFKNREKSIRNLINAVEFTIKNFDKPTINIVEENKTILPPQEVKLVKPELKQVLYTKAEFHLFGLLRKFKYATETSLGTGFIEVFNTILEVEAPVHINRIYQLMLPYYEREKVTSFVMNQFNRQFSYLSATNKLDFIQDGRHFMPFGFDNFVFRTYPDNTKRPFDEVHDLELLDGFKKALIHYRIMKKEALAAHMFNALNYKGFNQDLIQVMVEKIDLFVKKGLLIEEGLSVKVTEQ